MNTAIIVAAGSGQRFGAEKPKQFLEIAGKPLVIHTLSRFEECPSIDEIILVLPAEETSGFLQIAGKYRLNKLKSVVAGGQTRAESVFRGLHAIRSKKVKIVAVHDGARPLVSPEEITQTIEKAQETGAACLVAPVTDTIKRVKDGKILQTIDRNQLRRALTPQCFKLEILQSAFAQVQNLSETATDECYLVEQLGLEVAIVEGNARNIKITHPEDLILVEKLLRSDF
jgi:2-C-methyl-D-erythritol 4-phosphate cytidylyltransferase